jgi:hypothetical protein
VLRDSQPAKEVFVMPASTGNGQAFSSQGKTRLVKQHSGKPSELSLIL